jgi:hypothetical protein
MSKEIERIILKATAEALNKLGDQVAALSLPEVPLEEGTLRGSAVYPSNDDGSHSATPEHLESMVSYNTVYAAAQHEGWALQHRGDKIILWVVKHHSEPGTKTHFLSDPYKAMVPRMEPFIAASIRKALDERGKL